MAYLEPFLSVDASVPADVAILLQDAQTSGGLLLASASPGPLIAELGRRGTLAAIVGQVVTGRPGAIEVRS
jgi:selenide,water dikinase